MDSDGAGHAVGNVAAGLFVVCVLVALMAITVSLTSGTSRHEPPDLATTTSSQG